MWLHKNKFHLNLNSFLTPETMLFAKDVSTNEDAKNLLKEIFAKESPFATPKPYRLIEHLLMLATSPNSIILDSFAGSGTTMHAVQDLNTKDKGERKTILVEMLDYAETITAERVRRIMGGYEFTGKKEETLYTKSLTIRNLSQMEQWLAEADRVIEQNKPNYDEIKKKLENNELKVVATKKYQGYREGLGGSFDYYELGKPLFTEDGLLNEEVDDEKIRQYIYYTETHEHLSRKRNVEYPYLLDYHNDTGYFFYYKKGSLTTLSHETLTIVPQRAAHYVIYADVCTISKEHLAELNIVFKKIPRDINRF